MKNGHYWAVQKVYKDIHKDEIKRYNDGKIFLPPPFKFFYGYAELVEVYDGRAYHTAYSAEKGKPYRPHLYEISLKELIFINKKPIIRPRDITPYMPFTEEYLKFAKKMEIKPNVIKRWQNKIPENY